MVHYKYNIMSEQTVVETPKVSKVSKASKVSKSSKKKKASKSSSVTKKSSKSSKKPRKKKTKVVLEESAPVVAVVEESAPVVVVEESAPVVAVEESAPVVAVEESAPVVAVEKSSELLINSLSELNTKIESLYQHINSIVDSKEFTQVFKKYRNTRKFFNKFEDELNNQVVKSITIVKNLNKKKNKISRKKTSRPQIISSELCQFLGIEDGTKYERTQALREISKYVKENELQLEGKRAVFKVDDKLRLLFPDGFEEGMRYIDIMGGLSAHFVKGS